VPIRIDTLYGIVSRRFRPRRFAQFLATFRISSTTSILDIGGESAFWDGQPFRDQITLLNIRGENTDMRHVEGDARWLPFPDQSFDIAFSNSVIEHLGMWEHQQAFAFEARRVGKKLWVQTPARSFPVEPHLLTPFIHWLPRRLQLPLLRHFTVWGLVTRASVESARSLAAELRLLNGREMKLLFPDCEIRRERVAGLTKSFIAVRLA